MATKAKHIKLFLYKTTKKCIEALHRIIECQGTIKRMYCDNTSLLEQIMNFMNYNFFHSKTRQYQVHKLCTSVGIMWHLIPYLSPHFGGL